MGVRFSSDDGKYIICGSEDKNIYVWKNDIKSLMDEKPQTSNNSAQSSSSSALNALTGGGSKKSGGYECFEGA